MGDYISFWYILPNGILKQSKEPAHRAVSQAKASSAKIQTVLQFV